MISFVALYQPLIRASHSILKVHYSFKLTNLKQEPKPHRVKQEPGVGYEDGILPVSSSK